MKCYNLILYFFMGNYILFDKDKQSDKIEQVKLTDENIPYGNQIMER